MALGNDPLYAEAVLFFDDENIIKEMLLTEFEAVLDNVVGIPEFSGKKYKAAYVTIWRNLTVHIVVLFELTFDKQGHVVKKWNLPLRYLGAQAINGPDLGQGKILLLMRNNCEEQDYRQFLWNAENNQIEILTAIRDSVKRNKLGLYVDHESSRYSTNDNSNRRPSDAMAFSGTQFNEDYQQRLINNIESTLKYKYEHQIRELEKQHSNIVRQLEIHAVGLQTKIDQFDDQMAEIERKNQKHRDVIVEKYQKRLELKLEDARSELLEIINQNENKIVSIKDQLKQSQELCAQLENSIEPSCKNAVQDILNALINSGVELIVTQTGIGSYSLKLEQIHDFIANPVRFWSQQCGVNQAQYKAWHQHFNDPVCQAGHNAGCPCNVQLKRIMQPKDFIEGESDMCKKHRIRRLSRVY